MVSRSNNIWTPNLWWASICVNQMNDDYFDLQVVLTNCSWVRVRPSWVRLFKLSLEWSEVSGQWSVHGQRSVQSQRSWSWLTQKFWVDWNFSILIESESNDLAMDLSRSESCSYWSASVRAVAGFPIMLWWSTVTSAMETVHSPQVLCRREGAAQPAILLKFWVWFFKLINSN